LVGAFQHLRDRLFKPDGTYQENAEQSRLAKQNTYGLFVQDSWRVRPNFTVNYGVRWQPQTALFL
jgi:outer membrane receptor protein involved in Fe transport